MGVLSGGIAFFDSGIGGLTVLQTCLKSLRGETIYYYGDNERAPYGNLPKEEIQDYVNQAFEIFARLQVKAAVIACNTVTALCIDQLRKRYDFSIVGAEPAIFPAAKEGGKILVLCTKRTSESERLKILKRKAENVYPNARITLLPCETLAEVIEKSPFLLTEDLSVHLPQEKPDSVVLGCTHYIYYKKYIQQFYNCPVFDGNQGIKRQLLRALDHCLLKNRDERPLEMDLLLNQDIFAPKPFAFPLEHNDEAKKSLIERKREENTTPNLLENKVFFLGSGHENNKKLYKQMFAFNKNG